MLQFSVPDVTNVRNFLGSNLCLIFGHIRSLLNSSFIFSKYAKKELYECVCVFV